MQVVLVILHRICLLVFLLSTTIFAVPTYVISTAPGGNPTVGYQGGLYAPVTGTTTVRGHVVFKNGFTFASSGSPTLVWDADGFMGGVLTFTESSWLQLSSDLRLSSTATFAVSGVNSSCHIQGYGFAIVLGGDMSLSNPLAPTTPGNLTIEGQGKTLALPNPNNNDYAINAGSGVTVSLKNVVLDVDSNNLSGYKIFNGAGVANTNVILENVVIRSKPYGKSVGIIRNGSITIRGEVLLESPGGIIALTSSSSSSVVIEKNSTLRIGKNTIFTLCSGGSISSFTMTDPTSKLAFDGCDIYTSPSGTGFPTAFNILGGGVLFENRVRIFNTYYGGTVPTDVSAALNFGDGTVANDVDVRVLSGAYLTVAGCMKYNHS